MAPEGSRVVGIGIDLVEVARMEREIARESGGFRDRVFTPAEIAYADTQARPATSLAARFAAKEAFFKALGTGWRGAGPTWTEVEIVRDDRGRPGLALSGEAERAAADLGATAIHVSLSHVAAVAAAVVVIEA